MIRRLFNGRRPPGPVVLAWTVAGVLGVIVCGLAVYGAMSLVSWLTS